MIFIIILIFMFRHDQFLQSHVDTQTSDRFEKHLILRRISVIVNIKHNNVLDTVIALVITRRKEKHINSKL